MILKVETDLMGEIHVQEEDLIHFPKGLPGFENLHRWVLAGEDDELIEWLISADIGRVALPVAHPDMIQRGYSPSIPGEILEDLQLATIKDALILAVLSIPRKKPWMATANLLAPIVVNPRTKSARQIVTSDERYEIHTPLLSEEEQRIAENEAAQCQPEEGDI